MARRARALVAVAAVGMIGAEPTPAGAQFHQEGGGWQEPETRSRERSTPAVEPRAGAVSRKAPDEHRPPESAGAVVAPSASAEPQADATKPVPPPPPRPTLGGRKALVELQASPFPYDGPVPPDDKPFFDVSVDGRRGRLSTRTGNVHWEDEVYSDRRALLYLTRGFTTTRPGLIVLFFHGNGTRLVRDVERRQAVLHQVEAARVNAAVVAPQLAVDAADSTPGNLWRPGHLATFLEEAAVALARLHGGRRQAGLDPVDAFRHSPVLIVGYSGGYLPTVWSLHHGGADERIVGVVVLDGMYGEQARFADWLERRRDAFLVSAYGPSSAEGNTELRRLLGEREVRQVARLDGRLAKGSVTFIAVPSEVRHVDFVTQAWVRDPLADVLRRLPTP